MKQAYMLFKFYQYVQVDSFRMLTFYVGPNIF